jgi:hypothetical protein
MAKNKNATPKKKESKTLPLFLHLLLFFYTAQRRPATVSLFLLSSHCADAKTSPLDLLSSMLTTITPCFGTSQASTFQLRVTWE